jgi:hypothetical protein
MVPSSRVEAALGSQHDAKEENGIEPSQGIRAEVGGNTCCRCARELPTSRAAAWKDARRI